MGIYDFMNDKLDKEMRELVTPVREFFPDKPEKAFEYFQSTYPDVIAGTIVSLVWGYIEFNNTLKNPFYNTRPITRKDIFMTKDPNLFN